MKVAKFWRVVSDDNEPKHISLRDARQAAQSLAAHYPGREFTIVESVESVSRSEYTWTDHE